MPPRTITAESLRGVAEAAATVITVVAEAVLSLIAMFLAVVAEAAAVRAAVQTHPRGLIRFQSPLPPPESPTW